jgi:hypothetical protein
MALLLGCVANAAPAQPDQTQLLEVSITNLDMSPGERITGFQIKTTAAGIYRIEHLPMGWRVVVDNDASWITTAKGDIEVGAAALDPTELQNLMIVEKNEFGGLHLRLTGSISVTRDFAKYRRIPLIDKNFVINDFTVH